MGDFLLIDCSVLRALEKRLFGWHELFFRNSEEFSDERRREHRPDSKESGRYAKIITVQLMHMYLEG